MKYGIARVRGWDRWITARRAQRGGRWFTVSNLSTSLLFDCVSDIHKSGSKCITLRSLGRNDGVLCLGLFSVLFIKLKFMRFKRASPNAPMQGHHLQNGSWISFVWKWTLHAVQSCSNVDKFGPLKRVCLPAPPTAVDRREQSTLLEVRRFSQVTLATGWPLVWPRRSQKENVFNTNRRFVVPFWWLIHRNTITDQFWDILRIQCYLHLARNLAVGRSC